MLAVGTANKRTRKCPGADGMLRDAGASAQPDLQRLSTPSQVGASQQLGDRAEVASFALLTTLLHGGFYTSKPL